MLGAFKVPVRTSDLAALKYTIESGEITGPARDVQNSDSMQAAKPQPKAAR